VLPSSVPLSGIRVSSRATEKVLLCPNRKALRARSRQSCSPLSELQSKKTVLFFLPIIRIPSPALKPAKYLCAYCGGSGVECGVITLDFVRAS
jgi:hypothetical protein